ncbi:tyrosine-type recombinase/integrase [Oscillochloris sp. ZM17-4]|nr:tyrosine-type recombinase/integrase [Oscillochloris sp. ZM17-4]
MLLMLFAGLRISEAAALRWREVDLDAGVLLVIDGKGGKDRAVPIHPKLRAELERVESPRPTWAVAGRRDNLPLNQKGLAHLSLETTQRYLMLGDKQLRAAIDRLPDGW